MKSGLDFENVQNMAYLAPRGSFTEMAAEFFANKFNISAYPVPVKTIKQVVEYLEETPDTLAVLPIENTTEGVVIETLDALVGFKNPNFRILAEYVMPAEYCLLARTTEISSIRGGIFAPPKISEKCANFIKTEFPYGIELLDASTSEEAARGLSSCNLTYASIGSRRTAELFSLNILKENINDDKRDTTRFILVGDFENDYNKNMASTLAFSTENKPGALLDVLQVFRMNKINLSYISSRPSKSRIGEYIFYVTFDGISDKKEILNAINQIKKNTALFRFLGSYERFTV